MPISYSETAKPSEPTYTGVVGATRFLLINTVDFLLINTVDKLIIAKAENSSEFDDIFTDVAVVSAPSYTEVTQP